MASFAIVKSNMSLVLDLGTGADGRAKTKTVTLSRLKGSANADSVNAVGDALTPLMNYPVLEVLKSDTNSVTA